MKYYNFDIVFQEIPDETTLAVNVTGCPFRCYNCHSPHLREDIGEILDEKALGTMLERYGSEVTCICIMGGDAFPDEVQRLAGYIRRELGYKSAWYSGAEKIPDYIDRRNFDFIKVGPYREELGGLKSEKTNQRLYKVDEDGGLVDITYKFAEQNKPLNAIWKEEGQ